MKIAMVTDQYLPQLGGVPDSIVTLAKGLRALGHTLRIYAPDLPGSAPESDVVRIPTITFAGGIGAMVSPFGVQSLIQEFKPDVIHVHSVGIAAFAGMKAGKKLRVPVLATCHGSMADYLYLVRLNFWPIPSIVKRTEGWYFNHADVITAPTQPPLDGIMDHGAKVEHMQVISNPIDTDLFRPLEDKQVLKKKLGIEQNALLLFGRLAPEKNLEAVVEIFSAVVKESDAQLVVAGDGPAANDFKGQIERAGLTKQTRYLGTLRGEALTEAINACDVMLMTSLVEAQGMTVLQAAACGVPAVGARSGGVAECIQDEVSGFVVDIQDKKKFVERLLQLLQSEYQRRDFGAAAQTFAASYAPADIAQRFIDAYGHAIRVR